MANVDQLSQVFTWQIQTWSADWSGNKVITTTQICWSQQLWKVKSC